MRTVTRYRIFKIRKRKERRPRRKGRGLNRREWKRKKETKV